MATANTRVPNPAGMDAWFKPVVFYDGVCPMCRREIAHYRRMDRTQSLLWVDITREPERVQSYGLTVERAMQRFHVLDGLGRWQTGVAAFLELWSHLPYYRWLASMVRALGLAGPLEALYRRWAGWRLRRRCGEQRCGLSRD
jgi:predicted DCC family thiol-disulfide oxidoreductase YuxK